MKSVELFAGAGGLALGTAEAGFQHKIVMEWDSNACATLHGNHLAGLKHAKDWRIIEEDVANVDFTSFREEVEFVSGGPPCQPFSLGGKHRGHQDTRNLFPQAFRAIRQIQPKAFIFENVKGLLRKSFANYYSSIIHQLRYPTMVPQGDEDWKHHLARLERLHTRGERLDLQYNVVYQLVNAVNYGVPQHRWRVFLVGIRSDLGVEFSFPPRTHEEDALLRAKWISGEYWDEHHIPRKKRPNVPPDITRRVARLKGIRPERMLPRWRTVRDAIGGLPKIGVGKTSSEIPNHFLNPGARSYPGHTGSPYDEPAKALKAGDHGVPGEPWATCWFYQLIVLHWIYPVETLIVATMLALVPCMVVRAIGNHIVTILRQRRLRDMKRVSLDDSRDTSDNSQATDRHDLTHQ
jgi:DNA (cytosine-5)-methyltransferase 1